MRIYSLTEQGKRAVKIPYPKSVSQSEQEALRYLDWAWHRPPGYLSEDEAQVEGLEQGIQELRKRHRNQISKTKGKEGVIQ